MPHRVLLTDYAWNDLDIEREVLSAAGAELVVAEDASVENLVRLADGCQAIMTNWAQVPKQVIAACDDCQIVARLGVGLDNIDVAYCTASGIVVTNVPDYCYREVAEHAISMTLCLARKLHLYQGAKTAGRYETNEFFPLPRIEGQTFGVVGYGRIGRASADRARGLGMHVLVYNRSPLDDANVEQVPLDEVLRRSDYVSLSLPLVPATQNMIGAEQFALMKPTAYLINAARGGLVDHAALAEALASGRLAGAGLDVHAPEPPPLDRAPWNDPRVLLTPHTAFVSTESLADLRRRTAGQVVDRLAGKEPENVRNPEVLK